MNYSTDVMSTKTESVVISEIPGYEFTGKADSNSIFLCSRFKKPAHTPCTDDEVAEHYAEELGIPVEDILVRDSESELGMKLLYQAKNEFFQSFIRHTQKLDMDKAASGYLESLEQLEKVLHEKIIIPEQYAVAFLVLSSEYAAANAIRNKAPKWRLSEEEAFKLVTLAYGGHKNFIKIAKKIPVAADVLFQVEANLPKEYGRHRSAGYYALLFSKTQERVDISRTRIDETSRALEKYTHGS
jgi:hypothetical protein